MLNLNGSYGEGGGSLVRVALALSVLTGKPFEIQNIRSGRPQPGLKAQHLEAIQALKQICDAKTNDITLGTRELHFIPGKVKRGIFTIDIGTAGSISLLLQALLLPFLFAPGKITLHLTGGTCGKWQASVDYLQNILLPQMQKFAEKIELKIIRRGYFPKGGGKIILEIIPKYAFSEVSEKVAKINLTESGKLEHIRGVINASADLQNKQVTERIAHAAENGVKKYGVPVSIRKEYAPALSTGGEALLWGVFSKDNDVSYHNPVLTGADLLLEPQKRSEEIGKEVAEKLCKGIDSGFPVDPHLADQLIMFMGILPGSEIRTGEITDHVLTNIFVVEQFLPVKFFVEKEKGKIRN